MIVNFNFREKNNFKTILKTTNANKRIGKPSPEFVIKGIFNPFNDALYAEMINNPPKSIFAIDKIVENILKTTIDICYLPALNSFLFSSSVNLV